MTRAFLRARCNARFCAHVSSLLSSRHPLHCATYATPARLFARRALAAALAPPPTTQQNVLFAYMPRAFCAHARALFSSTAGFAQHMFARNKTRFAYARRNARAYAAVRWAARRQNGMAVWLCGAPTLLRLYRELPLMDFGRRQRTVWTVGHPPLPGHCCDIRALRTMILLFRRALRRFLGDHYPSHFSCCLVPGLDHTLSKFGALIKHLLASLPF